MRGYLIGRSDAIERYSHVTVSAVEQRRYGQRRQKFAGTGLERIDWNPRASSSLGVLNSFQTLTQSKVIWPRFALTFCR